MPFVCLVCRQNGRYSHREELDFRFWHGEFFTSTPETHLCIVFIQVIDGGVTGQALIDFVLCNLCLNQLVLGFPPKC